jgi:hypothetical protein
MEVWRELMKKPRQTDSLAIGLFVVAVLYTIYRGSTHTILVGIAFTLIVLGALPHQVALAFLVGASAILLVQTNGSAIERFESGSDKKGVGSSIPADAVGSDVPTVVEDPDAEAVYDTERAENDEEAIDQLKADKKKEAADAIDKSKPQLAEKFATKEGAKAKSKKPMLPDNTDRREPLVLGKEYKLPNENDDKGFHLDSGTTFLNAYKALKPDQIAAMTKDTQELLATQKSLVAMLDSFGPLMKDMSKITGFFGPTGQ